MSERTDFQPLIAYLKKAPGFVGPIGSGVSEQAQWWVKFVIHIDHPLAWRVIQELGHVLNYVSIKERLSTVFMPVSPPPYLNGGPRDFLSWVIEARDADFTPADCAQWLEGRLPQPVDDPKQWKMDEG